MKKILTFVTVLIICFNSAMAQLADSNTNSAEQSASEQKKLSGSFEMNYLRHYLWRGAEFGNNDVAQPELVLTKNNFSLALCANFNYIPKNVPKEYYTKNAFFDEQDVEIRYANTWGKFDCEFKAMAYFYFFQPASPSTAELYSWTGYPIYKGLSFFTENSIDIASYAGAIYSNNGLYFEKSLESKNIDIEASLYGGIASKKFNQSYFEKESGGLNLIGTNISVIKNINNFYIKFSGEINRYTDSGIKSSTGLKGTDNFGFAAGINF
jgi:hypothetical protein